LETNLTELGGGLHVEMVGKDEARTTIRLVA
jgi:hypothetical protein